MWNTDKDPNDNVSSVDKNLEDKENVSGNIPAEEKVKVKPLPDGYVEDDGFLYHIK